MRFAIAPRVPFSLLSLFSWKAGARRAPRPPRSSPCKRAEPDPLPQSLIPADGGPEKGATRGGPWPDGPPLVRTSSQRRTPTISIAASSCRFFAERAPPGERRATDSGRTARLEPRPPTSAFLKRFAVSR